MSNRKLVSFRLPDDLMQDLRERADHDGISVTELVCRFIRQGLQTGVDERVVTLANQVDDRIAFLEAEIRELKRKQSVNPAPPTPLYALLTQGSISHDNDLEMKARLVRLEQMMEKFIAHSGIDAPPASDSCSGKGKATAQARREE